MDELQKRVTLLNEKIAKKQKKISILKSLNGRLWDLVHRHVDDASYVFCPNYGSIENCDLFWTHSDNKSLKRCNGCDAEVCDSCYEQSKCVTCKYLLCEQCCDNPRWRAFYHMEHGFENGCVECETNFFWDKQKESNENGGSSDGESDENGESIENSDA